MGAHAEIFQIYSPHSCHSSKSCRPGRGTGCCTSVHPGLGRLAAAGMGGWVVVVVGRRGWGVESRTLRSRRALSNSVRGHVNPVGQREFFSPACPHARQPRIELPSLLLLMQAGTGVLLSYAQAVVQSGRQALTTQTSAEQTRGAGHSHWLGQVSNPPPEAQRGSCRG